MERLYEKVFAELERERTEENSKFFDIERVLRLVSEQYYDLAEECEEEIEEYAEQIWERYKQHLLTIDPKADIMEDGLVLGLTGWDAWIDELDDEWTEEDEAEYQKNLEWLQNIVDEVVEEAGDDEEEDEEDSPTELCDRIEDHIRDLLNGEGDEVYDEYTTIALSEDKESVIVTRGIEQESETFKISDYKGLAYLVIAIYGFLHN